MPIYFYSALNKPIVPCYYCDQNGKLHRQKERTLTIRKLIRGGTLLGVEGIGFFFVILFFSKVAIPRNIAKIWLYLDWLYIWFFQNGGYTKIWLYHKKVAIHYLAILCKWLYFCFSPPNPVTYFIEDITHLFGQLNESWLTWVKRTIRWSRVILVSNLSPANAHLRK